MDGGRVGRECRGELVWVENQCGSAEGGGRRGGWRTGSPEVEGRRRNVHKYFYCTFSIIFMNSENGRQENLMSLRRVEK